MEPDDSICFQKYLVRTQLSRSPPPRAGGQALDTVGYVPVKSKEELLSLQNSINCQLLQNSVNS